MARQPSMAALIAAYEMKPHPEGGFYRELWSSGVASHIYYLLAPEEAGTWHRIQSEEIWLWHCGSEAVLWLGGTGKQPRPGKRHLLGAGEYSLRIPGQTWQRAVNRGDAYVFFSCLTMPAYREEELELFYTKA